MLPEVVEFAGGTFRSDIGLFIILSIGLAFFLEKYIPWHHHVRSKEKTISDEGMKVKPYVYYILYGDAIYNFVDGIALVVSFNINFKIGLIVFFGVVIHELAQEFGDFAILVHGGLHPQRVLIFNLISGLTAVVGAFVGIILLNFEEIIKEHCCTLFNCWNIYLFKYIRLNA